MSIFDPDATLFTGSHDRVRTEQTDLDPETSPQDAPAHASEYLAEQEPRLQTRYHDAEYGSDKPTREIPDQDHDRDPGQKPSQEAANERAEAQARVTRILHRIAEATVWTAGILVLLAAIVYFGGSFWLRSSVRAALPQIDGSLPLPGLSAPVTVARDAQGVPHIRAGSIDDLVRAQGFVTASDRLFQMDLLRRHAAGELAAILGPSLVAHDRLQRTLQVRAAADRALARLPPDQLHMLELYAAGVNAYRTAAADHLPIEFRVLHYDPAPWTPRDSILVDLAMFEDLTSQFPAKLQRETLTARLPAELVQDLYPVGSWRDHTPDQPVPDLTLPGPPILQVPLDESQAALQLPQRPANPDAATLQASLAALFNKADTSCADCRPGSNAWAVSGAHTASGKPLLSNDMHLNLTVPGVWYEADLAADGAEPVHVAGVSLPGIPLIVVGHNEHVAWGFTNLGADVQDVYIEQTRGSGGQTEFLATDGSWQPVVHLPEHIVVRGSADETLDVTATRHGDMLTPILTPVLRDRSRILSLRWTLYDPSALELPVLAIARMHDWASFNEAFAHFGGPAQNVLYADDAGHIGYHAVGRIPLRGPAQMTSVAAPQPAAPAPQPADPANETAIPAGIDAAPAPVVQLSGPLSAVPVAPDAVNAWSGYIPYSRLPQVFDPPGGVLATANARVTPDDYPYPITLNWAAPYRNDRLWHMLAHRRGLTPLDMLALQSDVYSDFDRVLAERVAYAADHSALVRNSVASDRKRIAAAADLLRGFNGQMTTDSPAAAVIAATHNVLWRVLLEPRLDSHAAAPAAGDRQSTSLAPTGKPGAQTGKANEIADLYTWGERDFALEEIATHQPPRWLPPRFHSWDDVLATALDLGLQDAHAPADLSRWRYGQHHTVEIDHPIFDRSPLLSHMLALRTGTGAQPQSGDSTTVKQTGFAFGPSERFTADLANLDRSTLNLVLGQSGNPASPWYMDQFPAWLHGGSFSLAFSDGAVAGVTTHALTLTPR